MARPTKQTVDYFPHDARASDGDTLTILEGKYGNDGYAFWFKLLERLASTDGHVIDCRNPARWQLLQVKTRVNEEKAEDIMNTLAEIGAIDAELWYSCRVIWCQNLVDNVADAYKNRRKPLPERPCFIPENEVSTDNNPVSTCRNTTRAPVSTADNPQTKRKLKENKNKTKLNDNPPTPLVPESSSSGTDIFRFYHQEIGELTPETIRAIEKALKDYPAGWIEEAVRTAVLAGRRNWRYIAGILENWKNEKPNSDGSDTGAGLILGTFKLETAKDIASGRREATRLNIERVRQELDRLKIPYG